MEELHIATDVLDRVCDEMVDAAAEVGHITGARFLQIVVDEGIKSALAMKLRGKLRITSVVPRRVRGVEVVLLAQCCSDNDYHATVCNGC
jgi:hypothetical protein